MGSISSFGCKHKTVSFFRERLKNIGVYSPFTTFGQWRLLDVLGEALGVRFEEREFGNNKGIDAWFFPEAGFEDLDRIAKCELPSYVVVSDNQRRPCGESSCIEFSQHAVLPPVLRGRQVWSDEAVNLRSLPPWIRNVSPIASKEAAPIWVIHEIEGRRHHYVSVSSRELKPGESLFQRFKGKEFIGLLPFLVFLDSLNEDQGWDPPPLQACFMFDDPNLHWSTYGFINFAELVKHAYIHNYHVSFATIPLDFWFVHKPTAFLFRQHSEQISLLIHGNDHVARELAKPYSEEERKRILRQALSRIASLERRSGVEVSRVMAAPHGACSESFLREMARLGFEAASISRGSSHSYSGPAESVRTFGMGTANIVAGLPVFPRFRLSRSSHNSILIAAFFRQPIIAVGHHQDVSNGLELLEELSAFINSFGVVQWANMKRISRSHYARKIEGKSFLARMFTKRIEVNVPNGISEIWIERSCLKGIESEKFLWRACHEHAGWKLHRPDEPIPVNSGQTIEILSNPVTLPENDKGMDRKLHLWPLARRQFTEARDRLAPILKRFSGRRSGYYGT